MVDDPVGRAEEDHNVVRVLLHPGLVAEEEVARPRPPPVAPEQDAVVILERPRVGELRELARLEVGPEVGTEVGAEELFAERAALPGMEPKRADVIVAGCAIVLETMHAAGFDELTVVKRALVRWSLRVGERASRLRQRNRPLPPWLALHVVTIVLMAISPFVCFPFSKTLFLAFDLLVRPPSEEDFALPHEEARNLAARQSQRRPAAD